MEFVPFDEKTIDKEFRGLPAKDRARLYRAMENFEDGLEVGFRLKEYDGGIKMITDSGQGQGRCLFFVQIKDKAVIVKVYKKETQKVPAQVIATAKRRMEQYEQG